MRLKYKVWNSEHWKRTSHLNTKNLSTNSSWDFDGVLGTMNPYWFVPDEHFSPRTSGSRWRCNSLQQLFQKVLKMKNRLHFQAKKTSATPKFYKRNFARMHRVGDMNFWSITGPLLCGAKKIDADVVGKKFSSGKNQYGSIVSTIPSKSQEECFHNRVFPLKYAVRS